MVWNNRRSVPSHQHTSKTSAKDEAKRLAVANPDDVFIILESIGHFRTRSPVEFTKHGEDARPRINGWPRDYEEIKNEG